MIPAYAASLVHDVHMYVCAYEHNNLCTSKHTYVNMHVLTYVHI